MKSAVAFLFISALTVNAADNVPLQAQIMQPIRLSEDLLGKVKTTETLSYKFKDGAKGDFSEHTTEKFDPAGNFLEECSFNADGTPKSKSTYTYDEKGNEKQETTVSDGSSTISNFSLDLSTRTIITQDVDANGMPGKKETMVYDNNGREHIGTEFDSSGHQTTRMTMERNTQGKEITVKRYDKDDNLEVDIDVSWNADGSTREHVMHQMTGDQVTFDIKYDYPEHDANGNWTKRMETTTFISKTGETIGQVQELTERTLSYY